MNVGCCGKARTFRRGTKLQEQHVESHGHKNKHHQAEKRKGDGDVPVRMPARTSPRAPDQQLPRRERREAYVWARAGHDGMAITCMSADGGRRSPHEQHVAVSAYPSARKRSSPTSHDGRRPPPPRPGCTSPSKQLRRGAACPTATRIALRLTQNGRQDDQPRATRRLRLVPV